MGKGREGKEGKVGKEEDEGKERKKRAGVCSWQGCRLRWQGSWEY